MSEPGNKAGGERGLDFIRQKVEQDLATGRHATVRTRFPPEPNGYLHIGHAKAICLNFLLAAEYGGTCNLRFDDTNPVKEEQEYIDGIREDVRWLGFAWDGPERYASDYFQQLYDWAEDLVRRRLAYVDDLSAEDIRAYRGTLTEPGRESPHRDRSVEENLDLLRRMRAGEFPDGARVLRARIDMAAGNINFRDPVMYRILHAAHPRTGTDWPIYPTYDWAHGQSDSIEQITHSLCTLEFQDHRPLYEWFLDQLDTFPSRQTEFARLNLSHTVLSKRRLKRLVEEGRVAGWDDPRMPTLAGLRRRGYSPEAIRDFCSRIGVARQEGRVELALLEHCLREDLNRRAARRLAVLHPLKVVLTNYPEDGEELLTAQNNPEDPAAGTRELPFSRELWIEREDFLEDPPKKFFRLAPGREVRLRWGYFIRCEEVVRNGTGEIVELRCSYDPATRGGQAPDGRRVQGTLHWVSARHAVRGEVRLYDTLFDAADPTDVPEGGDFLDSLNPESLVVVEDACFEPSLAAARPGEYQQFERLGYFTPDPDGSPERPVFNRAVALRDTWAKLQKPGR